MKQQVTTIALCLACGLVLRALDAPLPFLFGSLGGCLIGALSGMELKGIPICSTISRTVLGVAIGTSLSWALVLQIPNHLTTLMLIPIYVLVIGALGIPYFYKVFHYDLPTAFYAAMPGGLQDMVIFGIEAGANPRSLSLIHATRVLVLVTAAPLVLVYGFDLHLDRPLGEPITALPISELIVLFSVGLIGWQICKRIGMFGASVLGPLLFSAPLALTGVLTHRPPEEAILVSQFFIGLGIGVHYKGITIRELRRDIVAALGYIAILASVAISTIAVAIELSDLRDPDLFLAFWPAGQAELAVLSLAGGGNLGVIVLHHLVRIFLVIMGAPMISAKTLNMKPPTHR